ncbi:MAG TPA: Minf_1886 family protein [Planctomycetota bacterium]
MEDRRLQPIIREIRSNDGRRYAEAAYFFVLEGLDFTMYDLGRNRLKGESRHISGRELLGGLRRFAQEEFGPLAPYAFRSWGIDCTDDFGNLVFQMCEAGLLNKRETDRPEDFRDGFDFQEAFAEIGNIRV